MRVCSVISPNGNNSFRGKFLPLTKPSFQLENKLRFADHCGLSLISGALIASSSRSCTHKWTVSIILGLLTFLLMMKLLNKVDKEIQPKPITNLIA